MSLGIDRDRNGLVAEAEDPANRGNDEWLFNSPDDTPDDPEGAPGGWVWNGNGIPVFYVRVNTLARADRRDTRYLAPAIASVEDHLYSEAEVPASEAERRDRMYRRRLLQTTIDLRNL